jgi:type II secretory pathway component PulC
MLKGLAIQRGFHIAEVVLVLVLAGIGWSALRTLLAEPVSTLVSNPPSETLDPSELFASVDARPSYDTILTNGLFGAAGAYEPGQPPPDVPDAPPAPSETAVETSLPLTLIGATTSGGDDPLGTAIIEVQERGTTTKAYYLGEEVVDRVFLRKVMPREVLLENKRTNRMETLSLSFASLGEANPAATLTRVLAKSKPASSRVVRTAPITLNRKDITQKLEDDYERYASTVDIQEVKDDAGKTIGITTSKLEDIPIAKDLGFKNGDVLVSVNNEKVNSVDSIRNVVNKYQNANTFRIGIVRGGQPMYFTYRLR